MGNFLIVHDYLNTPQFTHADTVHIRHMSKERLLRRLLSHVPQFARLIYGSRDVGRFIRGQRNGYDISGMRIEFRGLFAAF